MSRGRIFVLGANGTIGKILCRELHKLNNIVYRITRVHGNLEDINTLKNLGLNKDTTIINCAFSGGKTRLGDYNVNELVSNIKIVDNLMKMKDSYRTLINIGSGAEYDISGDIINAVEDDVLHCTPKESYGLAKNIIARMIIENDFGFNLKLFTCFDKEDPPFRLIPKFIEEYEQTGCFTIERDRVMSVISGIDFADIIHHIIKHDIPDMDMNCVYPQKMSVSKFIETFANERGMKPTIFVKSAGGPEYSGDGTLLDELLDMSDWEDRMRLSMRNYYD